MSGAYFQPSAILSGGAARWRSGFLRQPLMPLAAAVCCGTMVDAWIAGTFPHQRTVYWIVLMLALVAIAVLGPRSRWRAGATVLVLLALGGWSHARRDWAYRQADLLRVVQHGEQAAVVQGVVESLPTVRRRSTVLPTRWANRSEWQTRLSLRIDRMRIGRRFRHCSGRVVVILDDLDHRWRPGDRIGVFGHLRPLSEPTNPGQRDLRRVYRQRGVHALMQADSTEQLVPLEPEHAQGFWIARPIARMATACRTALMRHLGPDSASLGVALVLGQRDQIDESTRHTLLVTGTAHLLSVSGLHLAIIVALAHWCALVMRVSGKMRLLWLLTVCVIYTFLTGARPPVVRAAVLVATMVTARSLYRPSQALNSLSLAALILVLANPSLLFSTGVQLSFLAVATLLLCGRQSIRIDSTRLPSVAQTVRREARLDAVIKQSRRKPFRAVGVLTQWIGQMVWISTCVALVSGPLVWSEFHVVSPISIGVNVLLSPLLVLALGSGVATALLGCLCDPLACGPGWVCHHCLELIDWVIDSAASIPGGHHWLPAPPTVWVLAYYGVLTLTLSCGLTRSGRWLRYSCITVWWVLAVLLALVKAPLPAGSIETTFLDVGHGTSVILRFDRDDVWLYDCGWLGNDTGRSDRIDSALWSLGVTRIHGIILSHADADHFNALPGLLERFRVEQIITPHGMLDEQEPALIPVRSAVARAGVQIVEVATGDHWRVGSARVDVRHPPPWRVATSDNANSLVLVLECHGRTLTLPGDLEPPGVQHVINSPLRPRPGGILMAPHHGSVQHESSLILHWARPRYIVISGGERALQHDVRARFARFGADVYITRSAGAVRVQIDRHGTISTQGWNESPW